MNYLEKWNYFPTVDDPRIINMGDEEVMNEIDGLVNNMREVALTGSLMDMLMVASHFKNDEDVLDLDSIYISLFEQMPSYPPVELFEDNSQSVMIKRLRLRCFNGAIIRLSSNLPIFSSVASKFFAINATDTLSSYFSLSDIRKMNKQELVLMLELANIFPLDEDKENYLRLILANDDM